MILFVLNYMLKIYFLWFSDAAISTLVLSSSLWVHVYVYIGAYVRMIVGENLWQEGKPKPRQYTWTHNLMPAIYSRILESQKPLHCPTDRNLW